MARIRSYAQRHLASALKALARAHVVYFFSGPDGGYLLARPPEDISLLEVIEAVEGPVRGRIIRGVLSRVSMKDLMDKLKEAPAGEYGPRR
jgi:DNA-binding IscR family transcriptional regulator